jgi:hypothetical protein
VVHEIVPDEETITCLEITAGQGTSLGYRLEHLAEIIAGVKHPRRMGVCLDTAHLFAAGYDFRGRKYAKFRKQVESTIGIRRVKVLHLNDSKKELGSRARSHRPREDRAGGVQAFRAGCCFREGAKDSRDAEAQGAGRARVGRDQPRGAPRAAGISNFYRQIVGVGGSLSTSECGATTMSGGRCWRRCMTRTQTNCIATR